MFPPTQTSRTKLFIGVYDKGLLQHEGTPLSLRTVQNVVIIQDLKQKWTRMIQQCLFCMTVPLNQYN